ncbi:GDSL lipase/esterase - like 10 [Theobroma cacao]|nr:GDSL lipase/esterase - like 10 [Theobroma cacao]
MEIVDVSVVVLILSVVSVKSVEGKDFTPYNFRSVYNFGDPNSDTGGGSTGFYPAGPPSGETFFGRPAERGCDGRLIIDFIAEHLDLPHLSPYLDSIGTSYRHGANFAIGGSTIRPQNESMSLNGVSPFSLDIQFIQYNQFKARTSFLYNQAKKNYHRKHLPRPQDLSQALHVIDIGQNDIAAGFRLKNESEFHASMPDIVDQLAKAVHNLYDQGARTFWIHNTGPIGCLPVNLHHHLQPDELDKPGCLKSLNDFAIEFNRQIKDRVIKLRTKLPNAALTYVCCKI